MQNLAASANLQLFSKALQESAQQAGDMPDQQQNPAISAADLQQFMLSQLDQQLYLSQLAGYGNGGADNNNGANALFSLPQQPVSSGSSDSATTTVSSGSHGQQEEPAHKQSKASSSGGGDTADSLSQRAQLVQQKLMEQFMEAATNGNASMEQQMNGGGGQQSDELSQLMAQLIGGTTAANGGGNAGEQLQHVQQQQNGGGGQQRGDVQSPSQQMSVLDQLQLLQMLGSAGGGGAALADLLAAGAGASLGSAAGLMDNGQLGQQQQSGMGKLQQHHQQNGVGGSHHGHGGGGSAGGSPAKDDTYCEICNKNVCNRYFLKIHLAKKHGIGTASGSPLKTGNGNFFGSGYSSQLDDLPARAQSASLQQHQQHNNRDSPSTAQHNQQQQQQRMSQKQSMSSTPGLGSLNGGHGANSSMNDSLSADQQLMSQCIMQQLAVQLELAAQSGNPADRPALIEQILNAGLPLAEMLQQQQQQSTAGQQQQQQQTGRVRSSSPQSDLHGCAHCTKQFGSQSALFQHQLTEHIGTTEQQQQQQQAANDQLNNSLAGMRWPADLGGGVPPQQQQQILGQLLSSAAGHFPIPTSNPSSLLLSPFGQLNPTELDGAAMLAKLSAELAAVSQPQGHQQQPSLLHQNGALQTPLQVTKLQAQQPPPQKRQYSSTSKNFCDLCNKEVCNKYFLRTHMLKMHNIVIDENKVVIANIDTAEKERKGEVKFRCEICLTSLANRDQLRTHKREVHGMQAPLGGTLSTPPKAGGGGGGLRMMGMGGAMETTPECRFTAAAAQQQTTAFPFLSSQEHQQQQQREHREAMMDRQQPQPGMLKFEPATTAANDENQPAAAERGPDSQQPQQQQSALPSSVKQLLSQLIGDPLLAPAAGRLSALSSKRQSEEQQDHFQQQHPQQLPTQQRQISDNGDTNNNSSTISCRFCGLCLESEEHLQLHQLMDHMDLMRPEQPEDLITQVALQMAEANSHKASALRKSSAASSGASSSSAASSSAAGAHQLLQMPKTPSSTSAAAAATTNVPCPQCKRTYKSAQKMEQHQRIVHHSFMAKISPTKRPVISPKKIAKLVKGFSCMKCQRRFPTKAECNEHVISAHLRPKAEEDAADNSPRMKRAKMESLGEEDADADEAEEQQRLLARWVREEQDEAASSSDLGRLVVDEAEEELEEKEENDGTDHGAGGGRGGSDQKSRPAQKQAKEGEKHSHTSGSTSPVSVHASSSGLPPEGFAHPAADHQKPFVLQSFTVRPVLPGGGGVQNAEPNGSVAGESALPDELIAYLPVRHTLSQPLRITLELQPNPQLDSEVRHL